MVMNLIVFMSDFVGRVLGMNLIVFILSVCLVIFWFVFLDINVMWCMLL